MKPLNEQRQNMKGQHQQERRLLADKQQQRHLAEQKARSARVRTGAKGVWDILTGRYFKVRKQNEMEAHFSLQRDRVQWHDLVSAQLKERQTLQSQIVAQRERSARQLLGLYLDASQYRRVMLDGQFERGSRDQSRSPAPRGPELGR